MENILQSEDVFGSSHCDVLDRDDGAAVRWCLFLLPRSMSGFARDGAASHQEIRLAREIRSLENAVRVIESSYSRRAFVAFLRWLHSV